MTVRELATLPGIRAVLLPDPEALVLGGYTSDLLSDVVANCPAGAVLLTIQAHVNTVAVCTLVGAVALLVCGGRSIPDDLRAAAEREGLAVLATARNQFDASHAVKVALAVAPPP